MLAHTLVICGASLTGDIDVAEAIYKTAARPDTANEVWHFARPVRETTVSELPASWWRVIAPEVDFDSLMAPIAEEAWAEHGLAAARWRNLVDRPDLAHLRLPKPTGLIELNADTRRELLQGSVSALVGRPNVGKTVGMLRLAHLRHLMQAPASQLLITFDPQDNALALSTAVQTPGTVVLVDDPFGQGMPAQNPRVVDFLLALATGAESWGYVSSRDANWVRHAGRLQRPIDGLVVATRHPGRWYEHKELLRLAESTSHQRRAARAVHLEHATTPPEVLEAARIGGVRSDAERTADARELIDQHEPLALACVLVRMQELRVSPLPEAELQAIIGCAPEQIPEIHVLLHRYTADERVHWAFVHPTSRQVTDAYLLEHHEKIERRLLDAHLIPSWIRRSLQAWRLQNAITVAEGPSFDADEPILGDWLTERLSTVPSDQLLREIADGEFDEWETIELAYALVSMWDAVSQFPASELLLRRLLGRPIGCYALLEACLFFNLGADDELWTRVAGRLWELKDPACERELVLALDAVLWREPSDQAVLNWATRAIDGLDDRAASFGLVRFAAGYHPEGYGWLNASRSITRDRNLAWSLEHAEYAAHLVAWHYAHQSRARAMQHRNDHYDKRWLSQSGGEGEELASLDGALHLARSLQRFPETAGWAMHLLCNLSAVAGLDLSDAEVREVIEQALAEAPAGDPGVISAVLAYRCADTYRRELRQRIVRNQELDAYLDALGEGLRYGELYIDPERFGYIHDPATVLRTISARFERVDPEIAGFPLNEIAEGLWLAMPVAMEGADFKQCREVERRIGCVERGDKRLLELQAARGGAEESPFLGIVTRWRETILSESQDKLL